MLFVFVGLPPMKGSQQHKPLELLGLAISSGLYTALELAS